jgi:hypothetical protein
MSALQIRHPKKPPSFNWPSLSLIENPFPESGLQSNVHYTAYQEEQITDISEWTSDAIDEDATRWSPLVIKGSVGTGKTHTLTVLEKRLRELDEPTLEVTRHVLTGSGSKYLTLGDLLIEGYGSIDVRHKGRTGRSLIRSLLSRISVSDVEKLLPSSSPIYRPLLGLASPKDRNSREERSELFSDWLGRIPLTKSDYRLLGVAGKIDSEGQLIRALAHYFKLLRKYDVVRVWIIMIDQIEDLYRKKEFTELRRARFLTDLRTLIDEGFEGAPLPLILAWNTSTDESLVISDQIREEYVALFSRLKKVVDIPALPRENARAFARQFVESAHREFMTETRTTDSGQARYIVFLKALDRAVPTILGKLGEPLLPRDFLGELHDWSSKYLKTIQQK